MTAWITFLNKYSSSQIIVGKKFPKVLLLQLQRGRKVLSAWQLAQWLNKCEYSGHMLVLCTLTITIEEFHPAVEQCLRPIKETISTYSKSGAMQPCHGSTSRRLPWETFPHSQHNNSPHFSIEPISLLEVAEIFSFLQSTAFTFLVSPSLVCGGPAAGSVEARGASSSSFLINCLFSKE